MEKTIRTWIVTGSLLLLIPTSTVWAASDTPESPEPAPQPQQKEETAAAKPEAFSLSDLQPAYWAPSPLPTSGRAMYYNPGVMDRVLAFRLRVGHVSQCEECIGYAAMLRAGDLDRRVWLKRPGHLAEGPFWVIDVADRQHIPRLLEREWVIDVDHKTAVRWQMTGPVPVTVLNEPSPEALLAATTLPLQWEADPVPAENFHWPLPLQTYHGAVAEVH